jgi:hypothetical protein
VFPVSRSGVGCKDNILLLPKVEQRSLRSFSLRTHKWRLRIELRACYKMLILGFSHPPCSKFSIFVKVVPVKVVHRLKIYQNTKFHVPTWLLIVLHPPQKYERPSFLNRCSYGIKNYVIEVTFNGMTFLLNFVKNLPICSEVYGGTGAQRGWWSF